MNIKFPSRHNNLGHRPDDNQRIDKINTIIQYGENKIKQIYKRISENEVRLESMESHSDRDYNDLLMESNEAQKEHKKDLRLFVDMLCKYKIAIK